MRHRATRFALLFLAISLAACGTSTSKRDGAGSTRIPDLPGDAVPRNEPRSRYGNGPVYEVLGKRYSVMANSADYRERGVASWYGKKFHGRLTSNREVYDMYSMTAAHKTLPLPTYVRVRNLRNNKSIVVRVNDRGPFVTNRIIDLSYAAALRLDMVRDGTSLVEVRAIAIGSDEGFEDPPGERPTRVTTPVAADAAAQVDVPASRIFVQVGAFGDKVNATRRLSVLSHGGVDNAFIYQDNSVDSPLFRVRIGPVADVVQYDVLVEELHNLGIEDPYLISQ